MGDYTLRVTDVSRYGRIELPEVAHELEEAHVVLVRGCLSLLEAS